MCLYYHCETSINPFQVSRVMLNHRKDPSLFTKAPLIPYLGSGEQEFPLLISVQNLPHAWDIDLAGVPRSIVVQIQKQSVKSFLNLHAFLTIIIKGELNNDSCRGGHGGSGPLKGKQHMPCSSTQTHKRSQRSQRGSTAPFQAVLLSTHILTADRRQLHIYLKEFSRHHSCLLEHKENTSPSICRSPMCRLVLFQLLLLTEFQLQNCLSLRTGFSHFNNVYSGQRRDGRGKDKYLLSLFSRLCHRAQSIQVCWHRGSPQAERQGQFHLPTWGSEK